MTLRIEDTYRRHDIVPEIMVEGMMRPEKLAIMSEQLLKRYSITIARNSGYKDAVQKLGYAGFTDRSTTLVTNETVQFERGGVLHMITYNNSLENEGEYLRVEKRDDEGNVTMDVINHWTVWSDEGSHKRGFVGHFTYGPEGSMTVTPTAESISLVDQSIQTY